jgi:adenylyl- and sulfurtransferase ThiI
VLFRSDISSAFATENQLNLARNLRRLITRPSYRVYTLDYEQLIAEKVKDQPNPSTASKPLVRLAAAKFAKEKRFKGIIFADVAGEIALTEALRAVAPEVAVFTPLIGLTRDDLSEMARLAGVVGTELLPQEGFQHEMEPSTVEASGHIAQVQVEQLSL